MSLAVVIRYLGFRSAVVGVLLVAALAGCGQDVAAGPQPTAGDSLRPDGVPSTSAVASSCPTGLVMAAIFPPARGKVRLRVINGSGRAGLATDVASELRNRGLQVVDTGEEPQQYDGIVILRYGPQAVGAAWDVEPFFTIGLDGFVGAWKDDFQIARTGDVVDVVLGTSFNQLASITEVNQATAKLGLPTAPPGTCASPRPEN
jgi:LytR cell envelope-related transcriptional attenuator